MPFSKRNKLFSDLFFISALSLLNCKVDASEPSQIKVYNAIYAMEFTTNGGETNWIVDGVAQKQPGPATTLTKSVVALISEASTSSASQDKNERNFMVAREALFRGKQEKLVDGPPIYLLDPDWAPCRAQSKSQMIVVPGSDSPEKKSMAWNAFLLKGCATHPNRYASLVIEGNNIDDIFWIQENDAEKKFMKELSARYYRSPDYYKGMSKQIVELDKKMQEDYRREDEREFKRRQEEGKKKADETIAKFNDLLKQSNAKVTPIRRMQKTVSIEDARIQPFINAVANDATFKDAKPILFIVNKNRQLVLFRHADNKTLKLTEMNNGHLNLVQTQAVDW